ncbi:MAG TPA: DMT family transporter [Streptosporangiaceae bacterium]|nr:DMT family transporter [Streptosporangiaceae bacterium]
MLPVATDSARAPSSKASLAVVAGALTWLCASAAPTWPGIGVAKAIAGDVRVVVIAIVAALGAALVFGVSSVAEQRGTKRVEKRQALSPRILLDLVRQPLWVAAIGGTLVGFTLQVVALGFGPLALVQPLIVFDLIFAVLINAYLRRVWDPQLFLGVIACAAGIGGFLAIARPSDGKANVGFFVILPLAAGLAGGVGGCLAVARRNETLRPLALALATGICYGVSAFLVKMVVERGFPGFFTDWPIYALAIVAPVGFILNQDAFQSSKSTVIAPVLSIITACDPIISIALATVWLSEKLNNTPLGIAGEVVALLLMVAGIVAIAHRAPHVHAARARHPRQESPGDDRASWTQQG